MTVISIIHTAAEGTLVYGTARGDGSKDVLAPAGFRWYRSMDAWGIVGSRDRRPDRTKIGQAATGLRAAGFTVTLDINDTMRPTVEVGADLAGRRTVRSQVLAERAERAAQAAQRAWDGEHRSVRALPPMGEPIKVGHHSEGRHRKAIRNAQQALARAVAASAEAESRRRKAEASEAAEVHRRSPVTIKNRIDRLQAEQRRDERLRDGYRRTISRTTGAVDDCKPATGAARERLVSQIADRQQLIDYWTRIYQAQQAEGLAPAFGREMIGKGDAVRYRNRWYEVVRVNAKSVTVQMSRGTATVAYHEISEHRRREEAAAARQDGASDSG